MAEARSTLNSPIDAAIGLGKRPPPSIAQTSTRTREGDRYASLTIDLIFTRSP
ncbi:hypothetical protein CKA32_006544 [Geitlerinema sp. FC II]|nr:hypothetical protein [Geitlerinema sp. CS-897]PPT10093.1 hypothetical protein CKA32_006544 [Geitlerinema sp. FC II]